MFEPGESLLNKVTQPLDVNRDRTKRELRLVVDWSEQYTTLITERRG